MGRRARRRQCDCPICTDGVRRKRIECFEAKMLTEELSPDSDPIYDGWFDWDAYYDT